MILVQLSGGLGNQLFQYAMGRSLALKNKAELKIDLSFFKNYEWHEYSLTPFNLKATIGDQSDIEWMTRKQNSLFERFKRKYLGSLPIIVEEKNLQFDPAYLKIKSPAYLFGYWQTEKYFKQYEQAIRTDLQLKLAPSSENENLLKQIRSAEAISLHIRRGNFVNVDFVNKSHGTCSMEYYEEAIRLVTSRCSGAPVFYIFSDDIPWAKANLKIDFPHVFVDINDDKTDYEDLRLMYSCKHHITANSTFSWWGAWLNEYEGKTVVAPKQWFADAERNKETTFLIPETWVRI